MNARFVPWLIAAAGACGIVAVARTATYRANEVPMYDAAEYVVRGLELRGLLVQGDGALLVDALLDTSMHPPGHPLCLALWMAVFGPDLAYARLWPTLATLLGLAGVVTLARSLHGERALWPAVGAAGLTLCGTLYLRMLASPMTEPTSLVVTVVALGAGLHAIRTPSVAAQLTFGVTLAVAGTVRYNLPLMILAPVAAHVVLEAPRTLGDPRRLGWVVPSALAAGAWQLLRPGFLPRVQAFLVNRDSELPFWSADNLVWAPQAFLTESVGVPWVGGVGLLLFCVGLVPAVLRRDVGVGPLGMQTSPGLRVLQLFVIVGFVALTLHPFKVARNLYILVPFVWLCGLLPWVWGRTVYARIAGSVGALAVLLPLAVATLGSVATAEDEFRDDAGSRSALDFIASVVEPCDRVNIESADAKVDYIQLQLWLLLRRSAAKVSHDGPLRECFDAVADPSTCVTNRFAAPQAMAWVVVTSSAANPRRLDEFAAWFTAVAAEFGVSEVARTEPPGRSILARIYGAEDGCWAAARGASEDQPRLDQIDGPRKQGERRPEGVSKRLRAQGEPAR